MLREGKHILGILLAMASPRHHLTAESVYSAKMAVSLKEVRQNAKYESEAGVRPQG